MDAVVVPLRVVPQGTVESLLENVTSLEAVVAAAVDEELVLHVLVEDGAELTRTALVEALQPARGPRTS